MKKRILLFFLVLFGFFWSSSVDAATPAVNDEAGLFTQEQIQSLEQQIQPINEKIKGQIFIVTTTSNSEEPRTFADD